MIILNKPNIWGFIWDLSEFLHIPLPFNSAPYVFSKMMGFKGKEVRGGNG